MGGDRHLLPAAARRAAGRRAGDPLADPGAVRPARGARRDRALPRLPARRAPGLPRARHRGGRRPRGGGRARARGGRVRRRAGAPARRPARRAGAVRGVDERRHPRAPAAAWPPTRACACRCAPESSRTARASATAGAAASGCRSAPTRRGWTGCSKRPACTRRASTSPTSSARATRATCAPWPPRRARCWRPSIAWPSTSCGRRAAIRRTRAYRDHHHRTARDHHPWANDGAVYDPARAAEQAARDAADFVARVAGRVRDGGLCVCALDTELLGHWWHEGPQWLELVVAEATRERARARPPRRRAGRLRSGAGRRGRRARDDLGHAA